MMGKRIDTTPDWLATEDIPDMVGKSGLTLKELHQYVYSIPVSALCSGCDTIDKLDHNVGVLQNFKELSQSEMDRLVSMAKPYAGFNVENYKRVVG